MQIHYLFIYFLIEKQAVTSFLLRKQITGPFYFSLVLSLSTAEAHNVKRLFGRAWVMASADLCCHSDSGDCGTNNNIINSLSGTRRSTGDQRQTAEQRRKPEDSSTHANDGLQGFLPFLPPPHRP